MLWFFWGSWMLFPSHAFLFKKKKRSLPLLQVARLSPLYHQTPIQPPPPRKQTLTNPPPQTDPSPKPRLPPRKHNLHPRPTTNLHNQRRLVPRLDGLNPAQIRPPKRHLQLPKPLLPNQPQQPLGLRLLLATHHAAGNMHPPHLSHLHAPLLPSLLAPVRTSAVSAECVLSRRMQHPRLHAPRPNGPGSGCRGV